jgi:hypothetical protein
VPKCPPHRVLRSSVGLVASASQTKWLKRSSPQMKEDSWENEDLIFHLIFKNCGKRHIT